MRRTGGPPGARDLHQMLHWVLYDGPAQRSKGYGCVYVWQLRSIPACSTRKSHFAALAAAILGLIDWLWQASQIINLDARSIYGILVLGRHCWHNSCDRHAPI